MAVTKLTLNIDAKVAERAKKISRRDGVSVSKLVEQYLRRFIKDRSSSRPTTSLMSLKGILGPVPDDFDYKDETTRHLTIKHK